MFNNIPQVTKNILILNVLFFLATIIFESSYGIRLSEILGAHYINSPLFEPYQVITHMFMHGGLMHIFFNMFVLVMFGSHLERLWGPKRFFIFYLASGLGAFFLYNIVGAWELHSLKSEFVAVGGDLGRLHDYMLDQVPYYNPPPFDYQRYYNLIATPMVGASGALFGVMAGFALLFPNTQLMLLFPPIPIRAKYLIGAYFVIELYYSFNQPGDSIAHLAHVGGAIVGGTIVLIQKKRDKTNFW